MKRLSIFILSAMLMAGCGPADGIEPTASAFGANYATYVTTYTAVAEKMTSATNGNFADVTFRNETIALIDDWQEAINAVQFMDKPPGPTWDKAWPLITDSMTEYSYIASILKAALNENNPMFLMAGMGRMDNANRLLAQAIKIVNGQ
jgi:hypothetical protein